MFSLNEMLQDILSRWLEWPIVASLIVVVIVISLLFIFENPFQYHIKFGIFLLIVFFYSIVIIPFAMLKPKDATNIEYVHFIYFYMYFVFLKYVSQLFSLEQKRPAREYFITLNHLLCNDCEEYSLSLFLSLSRFMVMQ